MSFILRNRLRINKRLDTVKKRRWLSSINYDLYNHLTRDFKLHVSGKFIDIGCGDMPYRGMIEEYSSEYDSVDVEARAGNVTYITDVQNMKGVPSGEYDSGMCLEVLEHVQNPFMASHEIFRIMKPGAKLIISLPHLSRLHEEPFDFFRYTKYGIYELFNQAGFNVIEVRPVGGILSFMSHQISTLSLCLVWRIPIIRQLTFAFNVVFLVVLVSILDKLFDKQKKLAHCYIAILEKPEEPK